MTLDKLRYILTDLSFYCKAIDDESGEVKKLLERDATTHNIELAEKLLEKLRSK